MPKSHLRSLVRRMVVAATLGFLSVPLFFAIGEPLNSAYGVPGLAATFSVMAVYFFTCQFFLSRGNPGALFGDWPVMLALDAVWIFILIPMVLLERSEVIVSQGLGVLLSCFGCTLAGAFAASKRARVLLGDRHISPSGTG